jgi:hypothetical protein
MRERAYREECRKRQAAQAGQGHERLQTKRVGSGDLGQTTLPPVVHDVLRTSGQPLDPATRSLMEPRLGHSFSDVRVHADSRAGESAAAVGAHAYTVGSDIVFGAGQYAPSSADGRRLIAHELAHVVQQVGPNETTAIQPALEIGAVDAPEEREADRAAIQVVDGGRADIAARPSAAALRRQPDEPTRAQIKRVEWLDELARWPHEAHDAWPRLSDQERTMVGIKMAMNYGAHFAQQFLAATKVRPRRTPGTTVTNVNPKATDLRARGYRLAQRDPVTEWWVHPSGELIQNILPSPPPPPATVPGPPGQQPAAAQPPEPPSRLPPRSTWGSEVRHRDGAQLGGRTGRATQYADGTVRVEDKDGSITFRPLPTGSIGYYVYDENGDLVKGVIWGFDPDDVFRPGSAR